MCVRWPPFSSACSPSPCPPQPPPRTRRFVNHTSLLLPAPGTYDPTSADDCVAGRFQCVDKVIREMTRRFDGLAESCDHDVMFSLTYLRTTEEYLRAATTPGFFQDPTFVNHEDAVFANYYFRPFDAWHAGRPGAVPEAWRIAFDAADRRTVTGSGDLDDMLTFQAFPVMRENAWRNAERLVAARTSLERALVEASIEQSAAATAHAIVAATAADAPTTAARDAFCAAHHDD